MNLTWIMLDLKKWEHQWDNARPSNELGSKISQTLINDYNIMCAMHCQLDKPPIYYICLVLVHLWLNKEKNGKW
jgi:hypothetical protein